MKFYSDVPKHGEYKSFVTSAEGDDVRKYIEKKKAEYLRKKKAIKYREWIITFKQANRHLFQGTAINQLNGNIEKALGRSRTSVFLRLKSYIRTHY